VTASQSSPDPVLVDAAKTALRDQLLTARHRRPLTEVGGCARALAEVALAQTEVRRAATVAAYVAVGSEPGTGPLLEALTAAGKRVILPVLRPDLDLDWGTWRGSSSLAPARMGLLEPVDQLGLEAVATADVVLVPGLSASPSGERLGRGGGSYDRALARVPVGTPVWVVLYDEEVGLTLPTAPHDRPVTGALTPTRLIPLGFISG
jgi:5-formyltetrahydrofolate cyclo-ligase